MAGKTKLTGVTPRGNSIQIGFQYKGKRCREMIKIPPTATNLKLASSIRGKILYEIALGSFNYADHFPESNFVDQFGGATKTNMTVAEALDWWWVDNKPKNIDSEKKQLQLIETHIKPNLGLILFNELKPKKIKQWLEKLKLSPSSKNSCLTPLRKTYDEAFSEGIILENIMLKVKHITRDKVDKKPLSILEIDNVLKIFSDKPIYNFYKFAIWTGLSTGEQLGLQWGDINFNTYKFKIERMYSKSKIVEVKNSYRERVNDLLSPAYKALIELRPNDYLLNPEKYKSEFIFKNPISNSVWRIDSISKPWNQALEQLKIPHIKPYNTRHTFASVMASACLPDNWIRQQMGHANMEMLARVYAKWLGDADQVIEWLLKHTEDGNNAKQFNKIFVDIYKKEPT